MPTPTAVLTNTNAASIKRNSDPLSGTPNITKPPAVTNSALTTPITMNGMDLPRIISRGRTGAAIIVSKVPSSFSRARDMLESITVVMHIIITIIPGTIKYEVSMVGLYNTRISNTSGGRSCCWGNFSAVN